MGVVDQAGAGAPRDQGGGGQGVEVVGVHGVGPVEAAGGAHEGDRRGGQAGEPVQPAHLAQQGSLVAVGVRRSRTHTAQAAVHRRPACALDAHAVQRHGRPARLRRADTVHLQAAPYRRSGRPPGPGIQRQLAGREDEQAHPSAVQKGSRPQLDAECAEQFEAGVTLAAAVLLEPAQGRVGVDEAARRQFRRAEHLARQLAQPPA